MNNTNIVAQPRFELEAQAYETHMLTIYTTVQF